MQSSVLPLTGFTNQRKETLRFKDVGLKGAVTHIVLQSGCKKLLLFYICQLLTGRFYVVTWKVNHFSQYLCSQCGAYVVKRWKALLCHLLVVVRLHMQETAARGKERSWSLVAVAFLMVREDGQNLLSTFPEHTDVHGGLSPLFCF